MKPMALFFAFIMFSYLGQAQSTDVEGLWDVPDWREGVALQGTDRSNIYQLNEQELEIFNREGRIHALWYPIQVTGLQIPFRALDILTNPRSNRFKAAILKLFKATVKVSSPDDVYEYIGLDHFPEEEGSGVYFVPFKDGQRPLVRMGISTPDTERGKYLTASCTACHSESLFGRPIVGLTNKTPRANQTFVIASQVVPKVSPRLLSLATHASAPELAMWRDVQKVFKWIGVKGPQVLGLDTSLATVSLGLSKRELDPHATITERAYRRPRKDSLERFVADSKPMPWFTLKYKTRWLSDGSVVAGNPVLTNILWNEIGRGVDLVKLESFLKRPDIKKQVVELTAAVFASTPPRYTDFFPAESIDLNQAKRGQALFNQNCFKCHGTYEKAWDETHAEDLPLEKKLATVKVNYPKITEVKDVGTDPNRHIGMKDLAANLNRLAFSKNLGIKVIPQTGYVPPPLVGIWSRWPYFHNNSAPTLCDVIRAPQNRPRKWYVGAPVDPVTDFDSDCNGFPSLSKAPKDWRTTERFFDVTRPGLGNGGHFKTPYTENEIRDLVTFLKTL